MSSPKQIAFFVQSPEALSAIGAQIAPHLGAGDLVTLTGDLGAGKTHFARAIIQARLAENGLTDDVPSPTYTLIQSYWDGAVELLHADLYRLGGIDGLDELGLSVALPNAILLVEWPDLLVSAGERVALGVELSIPDNGVGRLLSLTAYTSTLQAALKGIADDG